MNIYWHNCNSNILTTLCLQNVLWILSGIEPSDVISDNLHFIEYCFRSRRCWNKYTFDEDSEWNLSLSIITLPGFESRTVVSRISCGLWKEIDHIYSDFEHQS
jgi:hypothetical protein